MLRIWQAIQAWHLKCLTKRQSSSLSLGLKRSTLAFPIAIRGCNRLVWMCVVPGTISIVFIASALIYCFAVPTKSIHADSTWRWLLFVGCLGPIWLSGYLAVYLALRLTETALWYRYNAIYYTFSVPDKLANILRALLLVIVLVVLFENASEGNPEIFKGYRPLLQVSFCLLVFVGVNLVKTIAAKLLASYFHRGPHFHKMKEAIKTECYIRALAASGGRARHSKEEADVVPAPSKARNADTSLLRSHMAAKLASLEEHIRVTSLKMPVMEQLTAASSVMEQSGPPSPTSSDTQEREAQILAVYIFFRARLDSTRDYITIADFEKILPPKHAQKAFSILDKDGNEELTLDEIKEAVIKCFRWTLRGCGFYFPLYFWPLHSCSVERISLMSLLLKRSDGSRIWYPVAKLISLPLLNLTRSDKKSDFVKVSVDFATPPSVLTAIKDCVRKHLESCQADFSTKFSVVLKDAADSFKLVLQVNFEYSHNGVDGRRAAAAKSGLLACIATELVRLGVPPLHCEEALCQLVPPEIQR
eukprot:jgi/Botrbrau1/3738/Bobra.0363s0019.3